MNEWICPSHCVQVQTPQHIENYALHEPMLTLTTFCCSINALKLHCNHFTITKIRLLNFTDL